MKKFLYVIALLNCAAIVSCKKKETLPPNPLIDTDKSELTLYSVEASVDSFNISSNTSWTITAEPASAWVKPSVSSGTGNQKVYISYQNKSSNATSATLVITDILKKVEKKIVITKIPFYLNPSFKLYGGTKDERFAGGCATANGGYILAGATNSYDGDLSFRTGVQSEFQDGLLVKYNADGSVQWKRTYGGNRADLLNAVVPAPGGGYFVSGNSASSDGDFNAAHGAEDFWVMKIKENGDVEWSKVFGGSKSDYGIAIAAGIDGGCIVVGSTYSNDGNVILNHSSSGFNDGWVIRVSNTGILLWSRCYGSSGWETLTSVIATPEGGYLLAGSTWGQGGDIPDSNGGQDVLLIRIKNEGSIIWSRTHGGPGFEGVTQIIPDPSGGYLAAGYVSSDEGLLKSKYGNGDALLLRCDKDGLITWHKVFGGSGSEHFNQLVLMPDKGILLAGETRSNDHDLSVNRGVSDAWMLLTNMKGEKIWSKSIGGEEVDFASVLINTSGKKIIAAGQTKSNTGDMQASHGLLDGWLLSFE